MYYNIDMHYSLPLYLQFFPQVQAMQTLHCVTRMSCRSQQWYHTKPAWPLKPTKMKTS